MSKQNRQYLIIRDQLAAELDTGQHGFHAKLPSERELSERYSCTRITVREALMQLEAEGLIYRRNRRGWFVTPPRLVFWPGRKQNFLQAITAQNRDAETAIVSAGIVSANPEISRDLGLEQGAQVYEIIRLRKLEQRPVLYETMYLSVERLPGLLEHPLDRSLTDLLETQYGEVISHEKTRITSATILPGATEALEVLPGRTGVCLHRLRSNAEGQPIELDIEYWLSDAIEIRVETHSE